MTAHPHTFPPPQPFLEVRVKRHDLNPKLIALCAGYESGEWRAEALASHAMEWIPEFALTQYELSELNPGNLVDFIRRAAAIVYTTEKFRRRGEFGELFLHAAIRHVYNSIPAISKIYYKSAANDTVKGFDAVHIVPVGSEFQLWLGEAKFYNDIQRAIADVRGELHAHLANDFLRSEFLLIANKIDNRSPYADMLKKLVNPRTSLDTIFSQLCIPVLLTYDSECLANHTICNAQYCEDFRREVEAHHEAFIGSGLPSNITIHLFLMPLHTKEKLVAALDRKLKKWQNII